MHVANLLFGTNSYEVYDSLKNKKAYLKNEITRLQFENARLQKEYFELKNLEPEE
ncbi:septum formation initiator [Candidatus Marinarcus aquaticus]|uniref:septum formation initiator n=1 Tax=Candidatus Marinarcus aquaticus TaxID=2044504 RepID=UPI001D179B1B|nr:septum formation initiator [Candidatus Marinarcus aquaticus]